MINFLTTRGVSSRLETLIAESKSFLILVSAYIHIPSGLVSEINAAIKRGVKVSIVFGKEPSLSPHRLDRLNEIYGDIKIYYCERLHAKAYLSDKDCIITSMNLIEYSENNNIEYGVGADSTTSIYIELKEKVNVLISESKNVKITNGKLSFTSATPVSKEPHGYCIRCRQSIPLTGKNHTVRNAIVFGLFTKTPPILRQRATSVATLIKQRPEITRFVKSAMQNLR